MKIRVAVAVCGLTLIGAIALAAVGAPWKLEAAKPARAAPNPYIAECGVRDGEVLGQAGGGVDPSTQTVEEYFHLTPPTRQEVLADFVPFPDGTEAAQREDVWQRVLAEWSKELAGWKQDKALDQRTYNKCVARVKSERAAGSRAAAKEAADRKRDKAQRRAQARLRCVSVGGVRISKSRPGIPCSVAQELARVSRTERGHAGWHRTAYKRGFDGSKLVTTEDANHELHVYRVRTLPYMQAIWRKGPLRVNVESGYYCELVC